MYCSATSLFDIFFMTSEHKSLAMPRCPISSNMAAVQHPTSSMNGDIKFTIGAEADSDDAFEAATLQDEVNMSN